MMPPYELDKLVQRFAVGLRITDDREVLGLTPFGLVPVRSPLFRHYVRSQASVMLSHFEMQQVLEQLEATASMSSTTASIARRVAVLDDGRLALDTGERVIVVAPDDIREHPAAAETDVCFVRGVGTGYRPQIRPRGGRGHLAWRELLQPLPRGAADLLLIFSATSLRPHRGSLALVVQCPDVTLRNALVELTVSLLDPRFPFAVTLPRDERDLRVLVASRWLVALNGVSSIPRRLSDSLVGVLTGTGFAARALHSDADVRLFAGAQPVVLAGASFRLRNDIAERAIFIALPRIAGWNANLFHQKLEAVRPELLHLLVELDQSGQVQRQEEARGAGQYEDPLEWAKYFEILLGWERGRVRDLVAASRRSYRNAAMEDDPTHAALSEFLERNASWRGTAGALYTLVADASPWVRDSGGWPGSPSALMRRLREDHGLLRSAGIELGFDRGGGSANRRIVSLRKVGAEGQGD